jgi:hypothetical protein
VGLYYYIKKKKKKKKKNTTTIAYPTGVWYLVSPGGDGMGGSKRGERGRGQAKSLSFKQLGPIWVDGTGENRVDIGMETGEEPVGNDARKICNLHTLICKKALDAIDS